MKALTPLDFGSALIILTAKGQWGPDFFVMRTKEMTKYALMLAAAGFVAFAPAVVKAEDHAAAHAEAAVEAKEATLQDGTKISIEGDAVFVVAEDGTKTAAPDGAHTLSDGTVVTTKDGKVVAE